MKRRFLEGQIAAKRALFEDPRNASSQAMIDQERAGLVKALRECRAAVARFAEASRDQQGYARCEAAIAQFKDRAFAVYEELASDERMLEREIEAGNRMVESWGLDGARVGGRRKGRASGYPPSAADPNPNPNPNLNHNNFDPNHYQPFSAGGRPATSSGPRPVAHASTSSSSIPSSAHAPRPHTAKASTSSSSSLHLHASHGPGAPEAVVAFDRFVELHGGKTGGWEPADHDTFLRLLVQYGGRRETVLVRALESVPGLTEAAFDQHWAWQGQYSELLEERKRALGQWKKAKQKGRDQVMASIAAGDLVVSSPSSARASAVAGNPVLEPPGPSRQAVEAEQARRQADKERIAAWKEEQRLRKEAEAREAEEAARQEKRRKRQATLAAEREAHEKRVEAELKSRIIGRHTEFFQSKLAKAVAEVVPPTAAQLALLREKDQAFLEARRSLTEARSLETRDKFNRIATMIAEVTPPSPPRDPSRLLRPTETVLNREADVEQDKPLFPSPGAIMPRPRGVPGWRKK
jgi:hypothetical protein